jgi:phosphatidylserine/phosphatidylglycerophosphate/cardiolipin synthase-like enzyme
MKSHLTFLVLILLTGCRHGSVLDRIAHAPTAGVPYCSQLPEPAAPQLSEILDQLNLNPFQTHAILLEEGASAIVARAWLTENAMEHIEAQYFIFSADNVGLIATDSLLVAAERGVQVRLLVDDTLGHGDPATLQALALHPNAEVRIYNPVLNMGVSPWSQAKNLVTDFRGANQRMHNKLFLVDGKVAITGGRNVASEYFDMNNRSNFRDRDILLIYGAVSEATRSFEAFWASPLSVPLLQLMGDKPDIPVRESWRLLHNYACDPAHFLPEIRERVDRLPQSFVEQREAGLLHSVDDVHYVWDPPGKNDSEGMWGGSDTTTTLIELINGAEESVTIQTPYLVTTELSQEVFRAAVERGVRVRILTNSLSVTDNVMAFSGYRRSRKDLLKTGVEIYELKPDPEVQASIMNGPLRFRFVTELAVHAKSMVIDGKIAVVGSFNLDPRSANLNTEVLTVLHSVPLARGLKHRIETEMKPLNSWKTTKDANPDRHAPWGRRLRLLWARLVPKSVL